jgi:hypothetical protein
MTYAIGQRVNRIEDRATIGATILSIVDDVGATQILELAYDEGGTGWWPADCTEPESELVRARNSDGTYRADDPTTPDVDEAWVPAP